MKKERLGPHEVACPYCGEVVGDLWELDFGGSLEGEEETDCGECGRTYIISREVEVTYLAEKKPGEDKG